MDEKQKLNAPPSFRWWMLILNVLAYGQFFMTIQIPGAFSEYIITDLGISATQIALFSTVALALFAFTSTVGANMAAKLGLKKTVAIGIIVNIAGALLILLLGKSYFGYMVCRVIQGFSGGIIASSMLSSTSLWFPIKQRALASGILLGILGVGFSIATFFAPRMIAAGMTWQMGACLLTAIPGVIIALLYYVTAKAVSDMYPGYSAIAEMLPPVEQGNSPAVDIETLPRSMSEVTKTSKFWCTAFAGFASGWLTYAFPAFLGGLLIQDLHIDSSAATAILSATFFVTFVASPLGGIISDNVFKGMRWQTVFIGNILTVVTLLILLRVQSGPLLSIVLMLAYGSVAMCTGPYWALPSEIVHPSVAGNSAGLINILANIGSLSVATVLAFVASITGTYFVCLWICVIIAAISAICMLRVRQ